MGRILLGFLIATATSAGPLAQNLPVLHVRASLTDASGQAVPVARHTLLISAVPISAAPLPIVLSLDGSADVRLQPGKYIVESDHPFVLQGRAYQWVRTFEIAAGRDTTLDLTAANAMASNATPEAVRAATSAKVPAAPSAAFRPESILAAWQDSAFGVWTPLAHAAGFLVDQQRGLVATSRRAIGDVSTLEVQINDSVKVRGRVVAVDAGAEVAIVHVHASAIVGIRPIPLACQADVPESERYAIDVRMFGPKDISSSLAAAAGAPVFDREGRAVGLLTETESRGGNRRGDIVVIAGARVCEAVAAARETLNRVPTPDPVRLPIESATRVASANLRAMATGRPFSLSSYQTSTSDFDVTFVTPLLIALAESRRGWSGVRADELNGLRVATDFENWEDYVRDAPPLVFVRATPRLVEGFWMKVARGAASVQGAQIPPIKRLRPGFSRMRLLCDGREVTPVHPFRIQARVTETDAIEEGFYAFEPASIGSQCRSVSVELSSVKNPERAETEVIPPALLKQVRDDFVKLAPGR